MTTDTVDSKDVTARKQQDAAATEKAETALLPAVDVYEDNEGITLFADLAGVSKDNLNLEVDSDTLTIEGKLALDAPEDMNALYADVRSTHYRRSFTLSHELDPEAIEANLSNGVLQLRLPKKKVLKRRKIEVQTG